MTSPLLDSHNLSTLSTAQRYNEALVGEFVSAWGKSGSGTLSRLVDFGAGIGTLTQALRFHAKFTTAIEPSTQYWPALQSKCDQVRASISSPPLVGCADAIFTSNVLEHIEDDESVLQSFFETLQPGGLLFIYVPALPHLFSDMDRAVGHVRRYTREELSSKLSRAGFSIKSVDYRDSLGVPASWWLKLRGSSSAHPSEEMVQFYDKWIFPLSRKLDKLGASGFFGKNLLAVATRPLASK